MNDSIVEPVHVVQRKSHFEIGYRGFPAPWGCNHLAVAGGLALPAECTMSALGEMRTRAFPALE
ncbi:hypothetical protein LMG28138_05752 [Pararobbsia alpina]|uniref:Uncharacterized protein n=1 Tax=Pararobbsia alpina TaxID=621374 RepID=A0A6S7BWL3_9BURK|nr:hypothetical protein LMG28138_05752 [Pararobbsia alpina]